MTRVFLTTAAITAMLMPIAASAVEISIQLELGATSDFERRNLVYECGTETPIGVTYINATPNFLAVVPVPDATEPMIFTAVISGSGVRYAAGHWIWWSKGNEATLHDVALGDDADPVLTCSEFNNTP